MATFKSRLPSTHNILLAFAAIVFPIHLQAFLSWMMSVPSLVKRFTLWDTIGVISYVHTFALIESMALLFVLVFLAVLLPEKYYRSKFVSISAMFIFITVPFAYLFNLLILYRVLNLYLLFLLLVYGILFSLLYWFIVKFDRVNKLFYNLISILTVLSSAYVVTDVIAIFMLIVRKIGI